MEKKELRYFSGNGYDDCSEVGKFEVVTETTIRGVSIENRKHFTLLSKAIQFYESINQEKAIWDMTHIPELLECHTYQ